MGFKHARTTPHLAARHLSIYQVSICLTASLVQFYCSLDLMVHGSVGWVWIMHALANFDGELLLASRSLTRRDERPSTTVTIGQPAIRIYVEELDTSSTKCMRWTSGQALHNVLVRTSNACRDTDSTCIPHARRFATSLFVRYSCSH